MQKTARGLAADARRADIEMVKDEDKRRIDCGPTRSGLSRDSGSPARSTDRQPPLSCVSAYYFNAFSKLLCWYV